MSLVTGRGGWVVGGVLLLVGAGCSDGAKGASPDAGGVAEVVVAKSALSRDLAPSAPAADVAELVNGATGFAFDLYPLLTQKRPTANFTYSPYSVSEALALLYAGADGPTATQIAKALRFTLPTEHGDRPRPTHRGAQQPTGHLHRPWGLSALPGHV